MNAPPSILEIARICHQSNKAYCEQHGDNSQVDWDDAPAAIRNSAIREVEFRIANTNGGYSAQHESWLQDKIAAGWVYGEVKDAELKTHPCMVDWQDLPLYQQVKDRLFCSIVDALHIC